MAWLIVAVLPIALFGLSIRSLQRQGLWSWPMFAFVMGFMGLEVLIICLPIKLANTRYFWPVWIAAWILAAVNFIWFLVRCRRWKPKPR